MSSNYLFPSFHLNYFYKCFELLRLFILHGATTHVLPYRAMPTIAFSAVAFTTLKSSLHPNWAPQYYWFYPKSMYENGNFQVFFLRGGTACSPYLFIFLASYLW